MTPRDVFRAYWRHARTWGERPELLPPPAARSFRMQYSAVLCLRSRTWAVDETALAFRRILRARAHRNIDRTAVWGDLDNLHIRSGVRR